MCGIVSMISKRNWGFNAKDIDIFEELLTVDQLRGQDATGAFCVHRNKQVSGIKLAATPWHMMKQPEYRTFRDKVNAQGRILVGHNRKATHGDSTNPTNAHPFVEENIILVHNGTLYNHKKIADRDVDSHAVAAAFAKGEYDEVLKDINGAYVFIWWDMKRNLLSVVRNDQRPLWKLENKDMIILCSEAWMGMGVARRNGMGVGKHDEFDLDEVPKGVIHHYEVGGKLIEEEGVKKAPVVVQTPSTPAKWEQMGETVVHGTRSTTTIPTGHTGGSTANKEVRFPFSKPKDEQDFKIGDRILVQITKAIAPSLEATKFIAHGITIEPGCAVVDCHGVLPSYVSHDTVDRWSMYPVTAVITSYRETVNGGPVLGLRDFEMTSLTAIHPTGVIAEPEWDYVVDKCTCKHCNTEIADYDHSFTSVKISVRNGALKYEVTCADCIEEKITNIEVKNEFTEGRIAALQEWEQKLNRIGEGTQPATQVQGNSTTH